jgi:endonuclease/exonuclease/phosphatase family metal-dependent hydrolase
VVHPRPIQNRYLAALLAIAPVVCASCVRPATMASAAPQPACRSISAPAHVTFTWLTPDAPRDRTALTRWCATVGPPLVTGGYTAERSAVRDLVVVSWNVHEGGADVRSFVTALRRGDFTAGRSVDQIVLLLQEAYRADRSLPVLTPSDPVPHRIAPSPSRAGRADVVEIARLLNGWLAYVPSMRNGRSADEDRGNAIVTTVPFSTVTAIELPFEHQRRVAVAARLNTVPALRVVAVHLDTRGAFARGGPIGSRQRQARALVEALDADTTVPTIVAGDLNTWLGRVEPAHRTLAKRYRELVPAGRITWTGPLHLGAPLDHALIRLPPTVHAIATPVSDRFGSDHVPIVVQITF